jgi:very-short-patch-repair endonuclease
MPNDWNLDRDIDGKRSTRGPDALIGEIAGRQHGVVGRRQLERLGLTPGAIDGRLRAERLHPVHRAVYAVGHRPVTRESGWMAAVLLGGPGAVLSHRAAGALWGLRGSIAIDVTAPLKRRPRPGISFHRGEPPPDERAVREGIPVTSVPRTILDLAAVLDVRGIERAINEAEVLRLWDELSLLDMLHRYPGCRGAKTVRAALDRRSEGPSRTRSELEEVLIAFADDSGFERPETNVVIEGLEVDCVWRRQRVIIEVDGWETHKTRAAFERDRERIRKLQAAGWRCVPVTSRQLEHQTEELRHDVGRLLYGLA